jgi:EmrB/QacA subfamily drug resistance transporter
MARTKQRMTAGERWTLVAVILGSGIVFLDSTVVNVALPRIGRDLSSSVFGVLEAQSYVFNGYLLTFSALLILGGAMSDYYGRKRIFAIGLVGFGATSVLCGMAWNMESLIAFRLLQGAAGALVVPGSLGIITNTFSGEQQGRAFGLWAAGSSATTIIGPLVGGILVDNVSWRAAFLINAPLVLFAVWATVRHVQESRDETATGHFDWLGAVVVAVAVAGLSFGAIRGGQTQWADPLPFISIGVGLAAAIAFPFLMRRSKHPLVPLGLFKSRNFSVTNLSTLVIYGALYVSFLYQGLFAQGTVGYTAAAAGLMGLPGTLFLIFFSSRFGQLAARYGPRLFMAIGPAVMGLGLLWLTRVPATSEPWVLSASDPGTWLPPSSYFTDFFPGMVVFGLGLTVMVAPLTTALMTSVPSRNSSLASAINNAVSRVGPQLAGAFIFIAIAASFYHGIGSRVPGIDTSSPEFRRQVAPLDRPTGDASPELVQAARESSTDAFHVSMLLAAGLLFLGAGINAVGIRNPSRARLEQAGAAAGAGEMAAPAPSAPEREAPLEPVDVGLSRAPLGDRPATSLCGPVPVVVDEVREPAGSGSG